jgi:glutathione S-transferase
MGVELWWGSGSTPAWRVMLGLAAKQLPYESHQLSFSAGDTRKPEFLALNPRGKVPTIRDGDFVLNESLAILAYLDRKYPERPLFGRDAEEYGLVWKWCLEFENHGRIAFDEVARRILFGRSQTESDPLRAGIPGLHHELQRFSEAVANGPLVGGQLSAADLVWYCGISFVLRAATRPAAEPFNLGIAPLADHYPAILAWGRRVEALPGFDQTVPPHWLTSDPPSSVRWL